MRNVLFSVLLAATLSGCATVSMVGSQATVETNFNKEKSSLSKVADAYTEQAERKSWVEKSKGLFGFARVLMDGADSKSDDREPQYVALVKDQTSTPSEQAQLIRSDIKSAAHGLDVATMEVEKLFEVEMTAKSLRADLLSYEGALVTAKQARRTFITALTDLEMADANTTTYALTEFDASIDKARDAADKLAAYAANRRSAESIS